MTLKMVIYEMVIPVEFNKQNMRNEWDLSKKHWFSARKRGSFFNGRLGMLLGAIIPNVGGIRLIPEKQEIIWWHQDTPRSNTSYPDAIVDDYWRLCSRKKADIMMENVHIRRTPETFTWGQHPLLTIIGLGRQGRCSVTQNTSFAIEK